MKKAKPAVNLLRKGTLVYFINTDFKLYETRVLDINKHLAYIETTNGGAWIDSAKLYLTKGDAIKHGESLLKTLQQWQELLRTELQNQKEQSLF